MTGLRRYVPLVAFTLWIATVVLRLVGWATQADAIAAALSAVGLRPEVPVAELTLAIGGTWGVVRKWRALWTAAREAPARP